MLKVVLAWVFLFFQIGEYNYYDLTMQKCDKTAPYSIHGLWPEITNTSWPQYCNTSEHFNLTSLLPLVPEMKQYWYSCEESNPLFWKHEWLKHGTCTNMTEFEFFNKTLTLYRYVRTNDLINQRCNQSELECKIPFNLNWTLREQEVDESRQLLVS